MKCCDYNAGMMREPVVFQRRTRTADGAGSWSETWATISGTPSRGHVTQTSGREAVLHGRKEAHAAVKIVTRYCGPVPASNWIELTEADVTNITIQNLGTASIFVQATTGSAPTTTAGSIEYPGAAKETNVGISELFPGVIGADRLWAYSLTSTDVFVSHDGGVNKTVTLTPSLDYTAAIVEADRVQVRAINYNILSVNNLEFKNQWLEIIAERGVPA